MDGARWTVRSKFVAVTRSYSQLVKVTQGSAMGNLSELEVGLIWSNLVEFLRVGRLSGLEYWSDGVME